ncbi:hypothetical protein [Proteus myxofaciens]|uniref:Uncharacterized protein n=1 Tax=Proteus myxofaciens ATCC 19692 TaxID=1354337 RepID=A0A198FNN7_9GAMM|nr:hypothetical protein [Proteus myxofaciens]OAT26473.1 hypothetical protein M983_2134 [Proteus myxofaciens ATCC 19692]
MQKIIKLSFIVLLTALPMSSFAEEPQQGEIAQTSENENIQQEDETVNTDDISLDQKQLLGYLSNSISFETERNRLQNELEIAKLKSEIAKIEQTNAKSDEKINNNSYQEDEYSENTQEVKYEKPSSPQIVLYSEVAGVSKFGVLMDNKISFLDLNKEFKDNAGSRYIINKRNNRYVVSSR